MSELNDTQAIIDVAFQAASPFPIDDSVDYYLARDSTGKPTVVDMIDQRARHREYPSRIVGHPTVHTHTSFEQYVRRHDTADSELWADDRASTVTAVFDSHNSHAGWGEHRVTLQLRLTPDWKIWTDASDRMMPQATFAEFIEDNVANITSPASADMLELAQSFQAKSGVVYESSKFLDSGHRQLEYREQVDAKAGRKGQLDIPTTIELALQPYVGLDLYRVTARFRYRINDGELRLGFKLDRPDDVLRTAFDNTVETIAADLDDKPILSGRSW